MGLVALTGLIFETILSINTTESLTFELWRREEDWLLLLESSHDSVSPLFMTACAETYLAGMILFSVAIREELIGLSNDYVLKYPKRLFR